MSRILFAVAVLTLAAASCARATTLGPAEAVEVMVLDGVDRGRATCVVNILDGQLELEKISGLTVELSDSELSLLSTTSAVCAPVLGGGGGVLGGSAPLDEATVAAQIAAENAGLAVEDEVFSLIESGLDRSIGTCLIAKLRVVNEPTDVLDDAIALSKFIVDCREEVDAGAPR